MEIMKESLQTLKQFTRELFPSGNQSVYAPPFNILSDEGRQLFVEDEAIRCIASTLFESDFVYTQESGVVPDGIVEAPRTVSGSWLFCSRAVSWLRAYKELSVRTSPFPPWLWPP